MRPSAGSSPGLDEYPRRARQATAKTGAAGTLRPTYRTPARLASAAAVTDRTPQAPRSDDRELDLVLVLVLVLAGAFRRPPAFGPPTWRSIRWSLPLIEGYSSRFMLFDRKRRHRCPLVDCSPARSWPQP